MNNLTPNNNQLFQKQQELYQEIFDAGIAEGIRQERERILEIEDLQTQAKGYEAIITEAKDAGISAMDTYKALVKAKRMAQETIDDVPPTDSSNIVGFRMKD